MSMRLKFNQILGLGIMALALYGCAQNSIIWEKYGSTQSELDKDKRECLRVAQVVIPPSPYVAPKGQMVSGWYVQPQWTEYLAAMAAAKGSVSTDQPTNDACMKEKGYSDSSLVSEKRKQSSPINPQLAESKEAVKWYWLAAEQGDAEAQFNLGYMYESGHEVFQDYKKAFKWYRLAAEQGHASAQSNLGIMYANQGVNQDYARAHMWYSLASAAGAASGTTNRDNIAKIMTPQQIEKAQEMAKACQARNFKGC